MSNRSKEDIKRDPSHPLSPKYEPQRGPRVIEIGGERFKVDRKGYVNDKPEPPEKGAA